MKRERWDELYLWQLQDYSEQSHKIVTSIPLKEYYHLGVACIENNITIAMFLKTAMRDNLKNIKKFAKQIKSEAKVKEIKEKISGRDRAIKSGKNYYRTISGNGKVIYVNINNGKLF